MDRLDCIKKGIEKLYKSNPQIHISVKLTRPKVFIEDSPAIISGVYKNIFQIEENDSGRPALHTFRYSDVLIGNVVIRELDFVPNGKLNNK